MDPLRKCIGCGEMKPKKELVRIAKTKEGAVVLDWSGKLNARGAYLCLNEECLAKAKKRKGAERSLKTQVTEAIYSELEKAARGGSMRHGKD